MRASLSVGATFASLVLLVCNHASAAGSMSATPIAIDKSTAPDVITLPDITVTLGNNLTYQDDVLIRIVGANVDVSTGAPLGAVSCPGSAFPMGYVTNGGAYWNFRVADVNGLFVGQTCTFRGLKIAKASIGATCELTSSYEANRFQVGVTIDSAGPITVANVTPCGPPPPQVIEVGIDIKPGTLPNAINTASKGSIPVAILSSSTFYAPGDVDLTFPLMFGGLGMQPSLLKCNTAGEDVNYDGYVDLVCHFATKLTGFAAGDTLGFLIGKAKNGAYITGWDSVQIVK